MERPRPNDSRLRQYAEQFDMRFKWETKPELERWWARVTLGRRDSPGICWASPGATEQQALDRGIDMAVEYYESIKDAGRGISHGMPPTG